MTQRLKRWESPRRQGRNDKGKGGSARARQLKKQTQMLRKKLKESRKADDQNQQQNKQKGRDISSLPFFIACWTGHGAWGMDYCYRSKFITEHLDFGNYFRIAS